MVHHLAVTIEDQIGVEDLPEAVGGTLVDPDRQHDAVPGGDLAKHLRVWTRHRDGGLKEPLVQFVLVHRRQEPAPERIAGQEALAERHEFRTIPGSLTDPVLQLGD